MDLLSVTEGLSRSDTLRYDLLLVGLLGSACVTASDTPTPRAALRGRSAVIFAVPLDASLGPR